MTTKKKHQGNHYKNPFFEISDEEFFFIEDGKDITTEQLDKLIEDEFEKLIKNIKGYYKHRFYQKLYYINNHLHETKQPYVITKMREKKSNKVDGKFIITFD
jgi:ethanolamine utilization protein EutA (predicted chaperonin)